MPTAEKAQTVEQTKQWYDKSLGIVFTDYKGLAVKDIQKLRADVRGKGGELHVIKNTLFRLAAGNEITDSLPPEFHNGTTAFAFVYENESNVAKALVDYARVSKKLVIKGGLFGGRSLSAKEVETLAELPPRDILLAQVIGAIASPLSSLVGVIEALYADPIRVIGAVADKVAESSPAPAKKESPPKETQPESDEATQNNADSSEPAQEADAQPAESKPEEAPASENQAAEPETELSTEEAPASEETTTTEPE